MKTCDLCFGGGVVYGSTCYTMHDIWTCPCRRSPSATNSPSPTPRNAPLENPESPRLSQGSTHPTLEAPETHSRARHDRLTNCTDQPELVRNILPRVLAQITTQSKQIVVVELPTK